MAIKLKDLVKEEKDTFIPTYGTGDVVHDCPKHVQEIKTKLKGKVINHSLNEAGEVNFIDVKFPFGIVRKDQSIKKFKILEAQTHEHVVKAEPKVEAANLPDVDFSTMRLKSDIAKKWDSTDDMMDDLRQWIQANMAAGGPDLGRDIADALKLMSNYALGEYKKASSTSPGYKPGDHIKKELDKFKR